MLNLTTGKKRNKGKKKKTPPGETVSASAATGGEGSGGNGGEKMETEEQETQSTEASKGLFVFDTQIHIIFYNGCNEKVHEERKQLENCQHKYKAF